MIFEGKTLPVKNGSSTKNSNAAKNGSTAKNGDTVKAGDNAKDGVLEEGKDLDADLSHQTT
jgi:hypothetical protein